jgi:hypothetical protein
MKKQVLQKTLEMIQQLSMVSSIKVKRNFMDFFADRIRQAVTEQTLMKAMERLCDLVSAEISEIRDDKALKFIQAASQPEAKEALNWLRKYPNLAAMLAFMKTEEIAKAVNEIEISTEDEREVGTVAVRQPFDIEIMATCTTPLAHGGDTKAGNATIFRRMDVMSNTNYVHSLPYYAGNAIRGQVRDLLADHFLKSLDIIPDRSEPPIELWFFHCLYSGGVLEESNRAIAAISKFAGATAQKAENIKYLRDILPHMSLLDFAAGNRIFSGRCSFGDWRPICKEWGYESEVSVGELFEWLFLTRREDHEGHEEGENSSMIVNTECLKLGTQLQGGINLSMHANEIEKAALAKGLSLLQKRGYIGAENRRDLGKVDIEYQNLPDFALYDDFLGKKKDEILEFLLKIEAIR